MVVFKFDGTTSTIPVINRSALVQVVKDAHPELVGDGANFCIKPIKIDCAHEKEKYLILVHASTLLGEKVCIRLHNIPVFFDILIPRKFSSEPNNYLNRHKSHLEDIARKSDSYYKVGNIDFKIIEAFPGKEYSEKPKKYIRVFCKSAWTRSNMINDIWKTNMYRLTLDDNANAYNYFRKASRENDLPFASWAELFDAELNESKSASTGTRTYDIDYKKYVRVSEVKEKELNEIEKSLAVGWDIETYSNRGLGDVPDADYLEDEVFMLCLSIHWKGSDKILAQICITTYDLNDAKATWQTVLCPNQQSLIMAFAICLKQLQPDYLFGFNDGYYDWPFMITKMKQFKLVNDVVQTISYDNIYNADKSILTGRKIKIDADNDKYISFIQINSCVVLDTFICMKRIDTKSESNSLNYFLKSCNLNSKEDMPISRLWKAVRMAKDQNLDHAERKVALDLMCDVGKYCCVDSERCQNLLNKKNIINDYNEMASLTYMSTNDSYLYAGGMKVQNLLSAYAWKHNISYGYKRVERERTKEKYPGAYVFNPDKGVIPDPCVIKGLWDAIEAAQAKDDPTLDPYKDPDVQKWFDKMRTGRPMTGLDFSSLYPSIIMAYNLSPECIVHTPKERDDIEATGRNTHHIDFNMTVSGRIQAWSIRHDNIKEQIGLYPTVLIDLFNKRKIMKKTMKHPEALMAIIELLNNNKDDYCKSFDIVLAEVKGLNHTVAEELRQEVNEFINDSIKVEEYLEKIFKIAQFDFSYANSKQLALKLIMNTFYGEAGNSISPFFLLPFAGGVTTAGRYNIKLVEQFVRNLGFIVKYGDTDSLYLCAPASTFVECDMAYARGEIDYIKWLEQMIKITQVELTKLRDAVNAMLEKDNGTKYLNMAYEEVLYKADLNGKKKYYGMAHVEEVNLFQKKPFVRGLEFIKQGQSALTVDISKRIVSRNLDIYNTTPIMDIVKGELQYEIENSQTRDLDDFVETAAYKPNRKNIKVLRFVERLRILHAVEDEENRKAVAAGEAPKDFLYDIPEVGARFKYIVAEPQSRIDIYGFKCDLKVGDRMMYLDTAKKLGLKPDIYGHYVKKLIGICARFINGQFEDAARAKIIANGGKLEIDDEIIVNEDGTIETSDDSDDLNKSIDKTSQALAVSYLEKFVKDFGEQLNKHHTYAYKRAYKKAEVECRYALQTIIPHQIQVKNLIEGDVQGVFFDAVKSFAMHVAHTRKKKWCEDISELYDFEKNLFQFSICTTGKQLEIIELGYRKELLDIVTSENNIIMKIVNKYVNKHREEEHKQNPEKLGKFIDESNYDEEKEKIKTKELRDIWYKLVGIEITRQRINIITNYVENKRSKQVFGRTNIIELSERERMKLITYTD